MALSTETLHGKTREVSGTRACRALRKGGEIPAIVYGHQVAPAAVQVPAREFEDALHKHARMYELDIGGQKEVVLLKAVQYDALGSDVVHADFIRVAMDEALTIEVPVQFKGQPKAEHAVLEQTLGRVSVECLPKDIPDVILLMVGDMAVGQMLHVSDLVVPAGVKILNAPEVIVAILKTIQEEAAVPGAVPAEGAVAEPEVIGRQAKEEGEEEAEDAKKK